MDREMVAVCNYANYFLGQTPLKSAKAGLPGTVSKKIQFISIDKAKPRVLGSSVRPWSVHLRRRGIRRVLLHYILKERRFKDLVVLADSDFWLLEAKTPGGSDLYIEEYPHDARRPRYRRVGEHVDLDISYPERLESVKESLKGILLENRQIAREENIGSYMQEFDAALRSLEPGSTFGQELVVPELAPAGQLSREATQLLAACRPNLVFAGNGSWHDYQSSAEMEKGQDWPSARLRRAFKAVTSYAVNEHGRCRGEWR